VKNKLEAVLKSKILVFALLLSPAVLIVIDGVQGGFLANPVEFLQLRTGKTAMRLLLITLWISPLRLIFPNARIFKILLRHRRMIGVSSFAYALSHFGIYTLDAGNLSAFLDGFTRYFIVSGGIAMLILLALAVTSNNWAVKKLGARRWKRLHRLVYIAAFAVFLHVLAKEKSNVLFTLAYFIPLALAEGYRLVRFWQSRRRRLSPTAWLRKDGVTP